MSPGASWTRWGSLLMFLAVAAGAVGAHAFKNRLSPEMKAVYETAARYHAIHALGLLAVGILSLSGGSRALDAAGWCFAGGIVLFSGSLYALALTGISRLGTTTPLGGALFLAGWLVLAFSRGKW